ncbi:MAG: hypothetical protein VKO00_02055 [Cyanobacteriota bacterium]|nr:hypothetical protein [Cyanobacteriota bacterium]
MSSDWSHTYAYLDSRGAPYGIGAEDLVAKTPGIIQHDPNAVMSFWQQKDISHIVPTSQHPELADSFANWLPEDPLPNHTRQDQVMTADEQANAYFDNVHDAQLIHDHFHLF